MTDKEKELIEEIDNKIEIIWSRAHIPEYANDAKIVLKSLLFSTYRTAREEGRREVEKMKEELNEVRSLVLGMEIKTGDKDEILNCLDFLIDARLK